MMSTTLPRSEQVGPLGLRRAGSGSPLVLLHGVGMQSAAWEPQFAAFEADHEVIAFDLPGHGGSARLAQGAELADFVNWVAAAIRSLGLGPVSIAGHSMGALVSLGLAATDPQLVKRVALLNGVYRRPPEARHAVEARADLILNGDFDTETPLSRWFGPGSAGGAVREQVGQWLRAVDIDGYATAYGAFARGDTTFADQVSDIRCPFLALTGDGDRNSTPEMSRAMAGAAHKGKAVIIEGHGHMVNLTAPQQVNAALSAWMKTDETKE